jgi:hypothetical protein
MLDRRRRADDLEGRSGLEHVLDRPIATRLGGVLAHGIDRRSVRERQNLPGLGIQENRGGCLGTGFLHGAVELTLDDVLEHEIDRQDDIVAPLGRRAEELQEHRAPSVAGCQVFRRVALELVVEGALDALESLLVDVGEPDDVCAERALRIEAFRLFLEVDRPTLEDQLRVELGNRGRRLEVEAPLEPDERLAGQEKGAKLGLGAPEVRSQDAGCAIGALLETRRMSVQRLRCDARGELAARSIDDRPRAGLRSR